MRWTSSNRMFEQAASNAQRVSARLNVLSDDLRSHTPRDAEGEQRLTEARDAVDAIVHALNTSLERPET